MAKSKNKLICVFLNDGQTYTDLRGCEIRIFPVKYAGEDLEYVTDYKAVDVETLYKSYIKEAK